MELIMAKELLDLHGYKADQVEDAIDRFLMQVSNSRLKRARIMTGKGSGTVQSIAIKYLKLAGYHWAYEKLPNGKSNEGCLVIFLD
jgi:DNA-nicking Smr family endonuclease